MLHCFSKRDFLSLHFLLLLLLVPQIQSLNINIKVPSEARKTLIHKQTIHLFKRLTARLRSKQAHKEYGYDIACYHP